MSEVNNQNPYSTYTSEKKKGGCGKKIIIGIGVIFAIGIIGSIFGGGGESEAPNSTTAEAATTIEETTAEVTTVEETTTEETTVEETTVEETTVEETTVVETTIEETLSAEETLQFYQLMCEEVSYEDLARNPNNYTNKYIKITGEVNQAMPDGDEYITYSVYEDYDYDLHPTYLDKRWVVFGFKPESNRILEDDIITFYGIFGGLTPIETVAAGTIELPVLYFHTHEFVE